MSNLSSTSPSQRRDSGASPGSPFRQRRSSLSIAQPPSPSLPLSAAASINAGMRSGSPALSATAKDSVASRRSSVVNELVLADDKLPPPAEIAVEDRKGSLADAHTSMSTGMRLPSLGALQGGQGGSRGSTSESITSSPVDPFKSGALRDPFSGGQVDGKARHHRTPSVSEVHQQMEQEQEAQVNRLLMTIHQQQTQIDRLQRQIDSSTHPDASAQPLPILQPEDGLLGGIRTLSSQRGSGLATPGTEHPPPPTPQRAHSSSSAGTTVASTMPASKVSPSISPIASTGKVPAMQMALSQRPRPSSSRGSSRATSPTSRPSRLGLPDADDSKYWQAEAANLSRENEALKMRIKELERHLKGTSTHGDTPMTNNP